MRVSSLECHATDRQSVASSTARPPGRRTRAISDTARSMSATSNTGMIRAASSRESEHRITLVDADYLPAVSDAGAQISSQEARATSDIHHVLAELRMRQLERLGTTENHRRSRVLSFEPS
jgi:hypothetical protein